MKKVTSFLIKHSGVLAALMLFVGMSSAHSACFMIYHQPKMPKALDEYRK